METWNKRRVLQMGALALASTAAPLCLRSWAAMGIKPGDQAALIVVDVQNCFVDGGTLPVSKGAEVVPVINAMASNGHTTGRFQRSRISWRKATSTRWYLRVLLPTLVGLRLSSQA